MLPAKFGGKSRFGRFRIEVFGFLVFQKQLSEAKKQSKLLTKIAENTEKQSGKSELLMK